MKKIECYSQISELKFFENSDNERVASGYAYKWGDTTQRFDEIQSFDYGSFGQSLAEGKDIKALCSHDFSKIKGRTKYNTLKLEENNNGLYFELKINPADTLFISQLERGDLDAVSVGVNIQEYELGKSNGMMLRKITKCDLCEISFTSIPAFSNTEVVLHEEEEPEPFTHKETNTSIRLMEENKKVLNSLTGNEEVEVSEQQIQTPPETSTGGSVESWQQMMKNKMALMDMDMDEPVDFSAYIKSGIF